MIKNGRHDLDCLASPRNRRLHFETVSVHEIFNSQTVQKGEVKVFDLHNHPKSKRAYSLSFFAKLH